MKKENQWDAKAKAPDPDDLTSELPPDSHRTHIDYTEMAHHEDIPDSADTGDPSRPQGEFWHRNERPGADAIDNVWPVAPHAARASEPPLKLMWEALAVEAERPTIFFVDLRHKS